MTYTFSITKERAGWILAVILFLLLLWCSFGSSLVLPALSNLLAGTLENEAPAGSGQPPSAEGRASTAPKALVLGSLAGVPGDGSISLAWSLLSARGGAVSYQVYRSAQGGSEILLSNIGVLAFVDRSVVNGVSYTYRVRASDVMGESAFSNIVTISPKASAAPAVASPYPAASNLLAVAGDSSVTVTWSIPQSQNPVSHYAVYRSTSPGQGSLIATTPMPFYVDSSVANDTTYYYQAQAVDSKGNAGPMSNQASATPKLFITAPHQVSNLSASAGVGQIALSWSAPVFSNAAPVTEYRLYRGFSGDSLGFYVSTQSPWYSDVSVTPGATYYYKVYAVNRAGTSLPSSIVSATPGQSQVFAPAPAPVYYQAPVQQIPIVIQSPAQAPAPVYYPPAPYQSPGQVSNLRVTREGDARVELAWSYPSQGTNPITGFQIFRGVSSGSLGYLNTASTSSYADTSVVNGTTYTYQVQAVDSQGAPGAKSAQVSATPRSLLSAPSEVTNLVGELRAPVIRLSWGAPQVGDVITSYRIYKGVNSATDAFYQSTSALSFDDAGVTPGDTYFYRVEAVGVMGTGPKSNQISVTYPAPTPAPSPAPQSPGTITNIYALPAAPTDGRSTITWSASGNIGSYTLLKSVNYGSETAVLSGSATQYVDSGLVPGNIYRYRAQVVSTSGVQGAYSDYATVTPQSVSYVPPMPSIPDRRISLNPVIVSGNQAIVSWRVDSYGVVPITHYRVRRGLAPYTTTNEWTVGSDVLNFTDSGLPYGATYYYWVVPVNGNVEGVASNSLSATISSPVYTPSPTYTPPPTYTPSPTYTPPPTYTPSPTYTPPVSQTPSQVTNVSASQSENTVITVSWSPVSGATKYKVYRGGMFVGDAPGASYNDRNWGAWNVSYSYQVSAVNSAEMEGARSNSASAFGGICGAVSSGTVCGDQVYSSGGRAKTTYACSQNQCVGTWKWVDGTSEQGGSDSGGIFCRAGQSWVSGSWLGKIADWYVSNSCR